MKYTKIEWPDLAVTVNIGAFYPINGVAEFHAMIELNDKFRNAKTQFLDIEEALKRLQADEQLENSSLILKRYFVSDAVNQAEFLKSTKDDAVAVSIVQQPPLNGTKVSVWAYFVADSKIVVDESGTHIMERPHFRHLYNMQLQKPLQDEYAETEYIFNTYSDLLSKHDCTLKDNCIRTWIYVQGVDIHYTKMVEARVKAFDREGLTKDTHYLASTGIEGRYLHPQSLVLMDAYSVKGIRNEQIRYLYAPTHLNPTYEYGVTFERATAVDYGDRRQIYVSGTASIDNKGNIVSPTIIEKQIERTLENISMLLAEAETGMQDIAKMIVYLRDTADYEIVFAYLNKYYAEIPKVIVLAPVCRPGWLIEIECIAIKEIENNLFQPF
ncbi:MAG: Rid family hydrolase [Dysgonomonas sp.]